MDIAKEKKTEWRIKKCNTEIEVWKEEGIKKMGVGKKKSYPFSKRRNTKSINFHRPDGRIHVLITFITFLFTFWSRLLRFCSRFCSRFGHVYHVCSRFYHV